MKKIILIPIIIGVALVAAGTAVTIYAATKFANSSNVAHVKKNYDIEEEYDSFYGEFTTADFEIKVSEDGNTRVECDEKEKQHHEVKVENKTLSIKLVDDRRWYEKWFDWDFRSMKVTVYVPAKAYGSFNVTSSTGFVKTPKNVSFTSMTTKVSTGAIEINSSVTGAIDLKASTGDIYLDSINAGSLKIETSTGGINVNNVTVDGDINTKCSTGHAYFTDTTFTNLTTKVSTGGVKLTRSVGSKHIQIKTSTGDVKFDGADAETLDIETDTGSVKGTLLTTKMFDTKSDTGSIKVPDISTWGGGICKIKTDTGAINISIKE